MENRLLSCRGAAPGLHAIGVEVEDLNTLCEQAPVSRESGRAVNLSKSANKIRKTPHI